jgi:hypothetical protein
MKEKTKLYFAYGSNLNLTQMAQRCPDARQLGATYIPNWRLVFRGVADIEPTRSNDVLLPVGVWEITKRCEEQLDIYEGFPHLYRKITVNGMSLCRVSITSIVSWMGTKTLDSKPIIFTNHLVGRTSSQSNLIT